MENEYIFCNEMMQKLIKNRTMRLVLKIFFKGKEQLREPTILLAEIIITITGDKRMIVTCKQ